MFDTVLIANRGEIALRIQRACRALGLRTIAAYSEADRDAPHVRLADRRSASGPPQAARSYLDAVGDPARRRRRPARRRSIPATASCRRTPTSPRRSRRPAMAFIGPNADCIRTMGDKVAAKRAMRAGRRALRAGPGLGPA